MRVVFAALVTLLVFTSFVYTQTYTDKDVFVQDLKIYVEGKEFFIKGIAYEPVPLGVMNMSADGWGGVGLCSVKKTAFNEYKSACVGSDFFDATQDTKRVPKGPTDASGKLIPWWRPVWERDLPKIKELGANTIRIYNMNPITKHLVQKYPTAFQVKDVSVAAQHLPFLDYAHKMGFKVILPIVQDEELLTESSSDLLDQIITSTVTELGDHPALLMWCLGNEFDLPNKPALLDLVNLKMDVVRQKMKEIHNRVIPVTTAVIDIPESYEDLAAKLKVDVFTTNAGYRDVVMDPLWDGETINGYTFRGWTELSKAINKPLFVGEIGMHQLNNQINIDRPDWFNQQWRQIVNHIDNGCVGACFFEYSDEPQKPELQQTMGVVSLSPATSGSKTSLDANVWVPDVVTEKNIYAALKTGIAQSDDKAYNMNANVFTLIGRSQTTVAVKPSTGASTSQPTNDSEEPNPRDSNSSNGMRSSLLWIAAVFTVTIILAFNHLFQF